MIKSTGETGPTDHACFKCHVALNPGGVKEENLYDYFGYILVSERSNELDIKKKALELLYWNCKHLRGRKCLVSIVQEEDRVYLYMTDTPRGMTGAGIQG
jgi:hypothetical protein